MAEVFKRFDVKAQGHPNTMILLLGRAPFLKFKGSFSYNVHRKYVVSIPKLNNCICVVVVFFI